MAHVYITEEAPGNFPEKLRSEAELSIREKLKCNRLFRFTSESLKSPRTRLTPLDEARLEKAHPISDLVTPYLKLFHWTFLVPVSLEFDEKRGEFVCKKANPLIRILSHVWILIAAVYVSLIFFNDVDQRLTIRALLDKMTWACYTLFDITVIYCLRMNGDKIGKLLTEGNKIAYYCDKMSAGNNGPFSVNKRKIPAKYLVWLTCLIGLGYTCGFVSFVILELTAQQTDLYRIYLNLTSSYTENNVDQCESSADVLCNLRQRAFTNILATCLLGFWMTMAFSVESIWVIFLTMTSLWGLYFKRLINNCISLIEGYKVEMSQGFQIYAKITVMLENFNNFFGVTILWIVIASVLYVASTIADFLAGKTNGIYYDGFNIVGFMPFLVTLYTGSELHKIGQKLPLLIKKQSLDIKQREYNELVRAIHGTSMIQYDSLSHNVGFKAAGFFTISYSFVASLVGLVTSYSLIALQFKIGDISLM